MIEWLARREYGFEIQHVVPIDDLDTTYGVLGDKKDEKSSQKHLEMLAIYI